MEYTEFKKESPKVGSYIFAKQGDDVRRFRVHKDINGLHLEWIRKNWKHVTIES